MRYWPEPSVTAERVFSMSAGLEASTVTPGRTAPDASFTVPVMEAWANAAAGTSTSSASAAKPTCNLRMHYLLRSLIRAIRTRNTTFTLCCGVELDDRGRVGSTIFLWVDGALDVSDSSKWI